MKHCYQPAKMSKQTYVENKQALTVKCLTARSALALLYTCKLMLQNNIFFPKIDKKLGHFTNEKKKPILNIRKQIRVCHFVTMLT